MPFTAYEYMTTFRAVDKAGKKKRYSRFTGRVHTAGSQDLLHTVECVLVHYAAGVVGNVVECAYVPLVLKCAAHGDMPPHYPVFFPCVGGSLQHGLRYKEMLENIPYSCSLFLVMVKVLIYNLITIGNVT